MGLEPTPGPWQGPVLPLYYDRSEHQNSSTSLFPRQVPIGFGNDHESLAHLQNAGGLDDRRFSLPFGEFRGFGAIGVNAGKSLAVLIKNGHLPVLVLSTPVFSELGRFSLF